MDITRRNIILLIVAIAVIIVILVYNSPDDSNQKENVQEAIKLGRTYAYSLLISDKERLSQMSSGDAKDKIKEGVDFEQAYAHQ